VAMAYAISTTGQGARGQTDSLAPPPPHEIVWAPGSAACDSFFSDGFRYKSIVTEDVFVAVTIVDTGWKLRVDAYIRNKGDHRFDVLPDGFSLVSSSPETRELERQSPQQLAKSLNSKAHWANFFGTLAANLQTQRVTTETSGSSAGYAQ